MDPSQISNPNNPNPSSILWAHQLRADIVKLTGSINNLHSSHASTTKILSDLGETVDRLHARIHALEVQRDANKLSLAQKDARLTELSVSHDEELGSYKEVFDDIRARLGKTELVNQTLQERIEILERPSSAAREKKSVGKVNKRNKRVASSGKKQHVFPAFVI
ncbi:hypothetical protein BJY01DRAFT_204971 [Aspergillus pseudoustus]|uniref:Uncharacterized protein n=1 Tax=Aspergillus pseudoustus TaxID=1810923 RepID=A0ABR4KRG5_9EURO